jgi:NADH dehydrogenase FAD-containing subunit
MPKKTQLLILGGGYAGMMTAIRLWKHTRNKPVAITLVNARPEFIERVRNHQRAAGNPVATHYIRDWLAGTSVRFVEGWIKALDLNDNQVLVEDESGGSVLGFDYLVYALGSGTNDCGVPGVAEHTYGLEAKAAEAFAARLSGGTLRQVLVVGSGNTGIETAVEMAEAHPELEISLASRGGFAPNLSAQATRHFVKRLAELNINYLPNTDIVEVQADRAITAAGETLAFESCIWAGGFAVSRLAQEAGLAVNEAGQIRIDPGMRSYSHPNVFAAGDAAGPDPEPGAPMRMSLYTALMMAAHCADSIARELNGNRPYPFGLSYSPIGISLGRSDGVVQFLNGLDRPFNVIITGKSAVTVREFFVRLAGSLIRAQRWMPAIFFFWPGKYKTLRREAQRQALAERGM